MKRYNIYVSGKRNSEAKYAVYEVGLGIVAPIEWFDTYNEAVEYCKENNLELI